MAFRGLERKRLREGPALVRRADPCAACGHQLLRHTHGDDVDAKGNAVLAPCRGDGEPCGCRCFTPPEGAPEVPRWSPPT